MPQAGAQPGGFREWTDRVLLKESEALLGQGRTGQPWEVAESFRRRAREGVKGGGGEDAAQLEETPKAKSWRTPECVWETRARAAVPNLMLT